MAVEAEQILNPGENGQQSGIGMEFHEVANLFPLMEGDDLRALVEDIRQNGLIESIWTYQGKIVDGRNRYRACLDADIEPVFREWSGEGSLVTFVIGLNLNRRHLTSSQKAVISVEALPLLEAEARKRQSLAAIKRHDRIKELEVEVCNHDLPVSKQLSLYASLEHLKGQPRQEQKRAGTEVYFIESAGKVKIGASIDPEERLKAVKTSNPNATLITSVYGGYELENELHKKYASLCIGGEWFELNDELRNEINELSALTNSCKSRDAFHSLQQAAKLTGTNRQYVSDVKQIKETAPEVLEKVKNGTFTVPDAKKLANMPEPVRQAVVGLVESGEAKSIVDARRLLRREDAKAAPVMDGKYRVIYADPPWNYGDKRDGHTTGAEDHYPSMTIQELCDLPVKDLAEDNAVLFLWVTSPLLEECFQVIEAWGFCYKSSFIWDKMKHNLGHYNSVRHELLLVCPRGSCLPDNPKLYDSVVSIERTEHSVKPDEFRQMIDDLYPSGARIELFARRPAPGWVVWGNEAKIDVQDSA